MVKWRQNRWGFRENILKWGNEQVYTCLNKCLCVALSLWEVRHTWWLFYAGDYIQVVLNTLRKIRFAIQQNRSAMFISLYTQVYIYACVYMYEYRIEFQRDNFETNIFIIYRVWQKYKFIEVTWIKINKNYNCKNENL